MKSDILMGSPNLPEGRLFLVTGRHSYKASGADRFFNESDYVHFTSSGSNPTLSDVEKGRKAFQVEDFDYVAAVGGGSVIDLAKLINQSRKPLLAIPTTAGTGSEVTSFATLFINGVKTSVEGLRPNWFILDHQLLQSVPRYPAICAGLDALCQSIESLWSKQATEESKKYAEHSVRLALEHIVPAVEGRKDSQAYMLRAAHLSGRAIDISKTTAAHALSYSLTTRFGIPHGHAVALTIDSLRMINRFPDVEKLLGGTTVSGIMRRLGVRSNLAEFGIGNSDIDQIANLVDLQRLLNNPVHLSHSDLVAMLCSEVRPYGR